MQIVFSKLKNNRYGEFEKCRQKLTVNLFIKLNVTSLPCIYIFQCLVYITNNSSHHSYISDIHKYQTRYCNVRTEYLRSSTTLNSFKNNSVNYLESCGWKLEN